MLLKISDGASGWTLFDGVGPVHLCSTRYSVTNPQELDDIDVADECEKIILISKECFPLKNGDELDVGILEFERDNAKFAALYTQVAYICDNNGTTVEKVPVFNKNRRN